MNQAWHGPETWERHGDSVWMRRGEGRERWIVLRAADELREFYEPPEGGTERHHVLAVNVYAALADWAPPLLSNTSPLTYARFQRTYEVPPQFAPWVRALDTRELLEWLESEGYR